MFKTTSSALFDDDGEAEVPVRDTDLIPPPDENARNSPNDEVNPGGCLCTFSGGWPNDCGGAAQMCIPPPPDFTGGDYQADLWELQFNRWWGWTWVRKNKGGGKNAKPSKPRRVENKNNRTFGTLCKTLCCLRTSNSSAIVGEDLYLTPTNSNTSTTTQVVPVQAQSAAPRKIKLPKRKTKECFDVGLQIRSPYETAFPNRNKHQRYCQNYCNARSWLAADLSATDCSNDESACSCTMEKFDSSADESLDYLNDRLHNVQCQDVCPCLRNCFFGCNPCPCHQFCRPYCARKPDKPKPQPQPKPKPTSNHETQTTQQITEISTNTAPSKPCKKKRAICCPCCARPLCPCMYKCLNPRIKSYKKHLKKEGCDCDAANGAKCSKGASSPKIPNDQQDYTFEIIKNKIGLDLLKILGDKSLKTKAFPEFKKYDDRSLLDELFYEQGDSPGNTFRTPLTRQSYNCNLRPNNAKFDFLDTARSVFNFDKIMDLKSSSLQTGNPTHMELVNSICDVILNNQKKNDFQRHRYDWPPPQQKEHFNFNYDHPLAKRPSTYYCDYSPQKDPTVGYIPERVPNYNYTTGMNYAPKNHNYNSAPLRGFFKSNSPDKIDKTLRTIAGISKKRRRNLNCGSAYQNKKFKAFNCKDTADTSSNTSGESSSEKKPLKSRIPVWKNCCKNKSKKNEDRSSNNNNDNSYFSDEIVLSNFDYVKNSESTAEKTSGVDKFLDDFLLKINNPNRVELRNSVLSIINEEADSCANRVESGASPMSLAEKLFNSNATSYDKIDSSVYTNTSQLSFRPDVLDTSVSPFKFGVNARQVEVLSFQKLYSPIDVNTSPFDFEGGRRDFMETSTSTSGIHKKYNPFNLFCFARNNCQTGSPYRISDPANTNSSNNSKPMGEFGKKIGF